MRKKDSQKEPSATSLKAIPPIDFARYEEGRQNPFASRLKQEGLLVAHEGPTRASLGEIPELSPQALERPNRYPKRIKEQGVQLQVGRRRPRKGTEIGPTTVKSVRLPPAIWKRLEKKARAEKISLHALVRKALVDTLG